MTIDKQKVGGVCNSLNSLSSLHRHKYAKDPTNMTSRSTSEIMEQAQNLICELWDLLELRKETTMLKSIMIMDGNRYVGAMDIEPDEDGLISVYKAKGASDEKICVLYVSDMDYGIVIPRDVFDRINKRLDIDEERFDG